MLKSWTRRQKFKKNTTISLLTDIQNKQLSTDLFTNEEILKELFSNCSDFVTRPVAINNEPKITLFYIEGLTDTKTLDKVFFSPLMIQGLQTDSNKEVTLGKIVEQKLFPSTSITTVSEFSILVNSILKGELGILVEGEAKALIVDMKGSEQRSVEEPSTEVVIRGPKDGFTETLRVNTSLLRKRIRSTRLKLEALTIGELSQTDVVIAYIEGIVSESLLQEVRLRLKRIEIDGILESEYIEEFIEDAPYSPFPQIENTERPDIVAAQLLEGRVAIFVDNTPFVLIAPMTFWSGFQSAEDYYERFVYTSFIRFIRFFMFNVAIYLPSIYVALSTYHPKLIPTSLLISIAAARENVPFPTIIEALMMELVFEGLREAGIRLPKAVGSAVSIVGALVIGQAAVQAGIVSAPAVIVVAATGIASFCIPRYNLGTALRLIRFPMLLLAGMFGLYGIVIGFIVMNIHLVNLRSFGVPYFTPVAPQIPADLMDVLIREPRWANQYGPLFTFFRKKSRLPSGQKPKPKKGGNET
ncbi:spore germination protein [Lederbergia panacisoli]|uniref:spore germination protein n=1 Tax=Lederbergia panacisoli TaxID=1255251 RepID=UPI00214BFF33|nr:spore germination protein [Lederbergia panacisoli]MCR2822515.1 spore germination protein [Lederbergia panacisoli]